MSKKTNYRKTSNPWGKSQRKAKRVAEAKERQKAYDALTDEEKLRRKTERERSPK